jgi:hypothetical protein
MSQEYYDHLNEGKESLCNMVTYLAGKRIRGLSTERADSGTMSATGGSISTDTSVTPNRKIHSFTSTGNTNFVVTGTNTDVQYLVVGGGGSGEQGGGGAGAVRQDTGFTVTGQTYVITVGAGSAAGANNAGDSIFHTITADGGNGGNGGTGTNGSGAGGYETGIAGGAGGTYGNNGGNSNASLHGAGGGGAGAVGVAWTGSGGQGGAGTQNLIVGSTIGELSGGNYYIGGGGGGAGSGQNSVGGLGGGGNGRDFTPTGGDANTGGGAGGSYNSGQAAGGSGVVIISYVDGAAYSTNLLTNIQDSSIFEETDTNKHYIYTASTDTWAEV